MKFIILFAALFSSSAMADEGVAFYASPKELMMMCPANGGSEAQQSACQNYVAGVVDAWALVRVNEPEMSSHLGCVPPTAKPTDLRQAVTKYVADNRGKLDKPAVFIVREAILKAYPCPAAAPSPPVSGPPAKPKK